MLAKVGAVKTMDGFDINPCGNFEFLFNDDGSLYPRDIEGIVGGLTLLDNFEKVLCYQYPRVFSDPDGIRIDEEKTVRLYRDYKRYQESLGGLKTAE